MNKAPHTGGIVPHGLCVAGGVIHELKFRAPGRVGVDYVGLPWLHDGAGCI
jgi:hypothetical protein